MPLDTASGKQVAIQERVVRILWLVVEWIIGKVGSLLPIEVVPIWQRLVYAGQIQQQTQWCWAAVSASVATFYNSSTTWIQCSIVNAELAQTTCCANGGSSACNKPWYLNMALQRVGHLDTWRSGTTTFADVRSEIDTGRPLCVRIGWSGGGGHFVAIDGYLNDAAEHVAVEDPWTGASDLTYSTLVSGYSGTGSWTHSYETQP